MIYSAFFIFYFKQNKHPPINKKNVRIGIMMIAVNSGFYIENH